MPFSEIPEDLLQFLIPTYVDFDQLYSTKDIFGEEVYSRELESREYCQEMLDCTELYFDSDLLSTVIDKVGTEQVLTEAMMSNYLWIAREILVDQPDFDLYCSIRMKFYEENIRWKGLGELVLLDPILLRRLLDEEPEMPAETVGDIYSNHGIEDTISILRDIAEIRPLIADDLWATLSGIYEGTELWSHRNSDTIDSESFGVNFSELLNYKENRSLLKTLFVIVDFSPENLSKVFTLSEDVIYEMDFWNAISKISKIEECNLNIRRLIDLLD